MDDGFGVRVRVELVAEAFEFGAQFAEIVDFAIEDDGDVCRFRSTRVGRRREDR